MIDINKSYKTRAGYAVRIYATDHKPVHRSVVGAVDYGDGWESTTWSADGRFYTACTSDSDLVEVKPRIQRTVWLNIYPENKPDVVHETQKAANSYSNNDRLACIKVEIDCEEGEGLDHV